MATRTKQLASSSLSTSTSGFYTVPSGKTAIIKQVVMFNPVGGAATTAILTHVTAAGNRVFVRQALATGEVFRLGSLFIVMAPGDEITGSVSVASTVTFTVSGAELEGVAT